MKPQSFFIDSTDGKLKWISKMPEMTYYTVPMFGRSDRKVKDTHKYRADKKLAKKEAVEVEGQKVSSTNYFITKNPKGNWVCFGTDVIGHFEEPLKHDKIYTFNMEEDIEVVEVPADSGFMHVDSTSYPTFKKVAKIIPKKAEETEVKYGIHQNFNVPMGDSEWAASNGNTKAEESEDEYRNLEIILENYRAFLRQDKDYDYPPDDLNSFIRAELESFEIKRKA